MKTRWKHLYSDRKGYCLAIFALFLGIFILPFSDVATAISNNAAYYLNEGWRLWNGFSPQFYREGYVARGPLYAALIGTVLGVTGQSITATFFFAKFTFFSTLVVFSLFVRRYLSYRFALLFLLLFFVSPQLYKVGTQVDTQPLHALLMTLFVWSWISLVSSSGSSPRSSPISSMTSSSNNNFNKIFVASFAFSLGIYNKEMTFLFLLITPTLLFAPSLNLRMRVLVFLIFALSVILLISPWLFYVYEKSGSLWPALGHMNPYFLAWFKADRLKVSEGAVYGADIGLIFSSIILVAKKLSYLTPCIFLGYTYLGIYLLKNLSLRANRNLLAAKKEALFLCLFLAATSQLITPYGALVIGAVEDVLRHAYLFYFFSIFGFLFLLNDSLPYFSKKFFRNFSKTNKTIALWTSSGLALGLLLFFLLKVFFHPGHVYSKYWKNYSFWPNISGRMTVDQKLAADFIQKTFPPGTPLHTDGTLSEVFDFFLTYRFPTPITLQIKHIRSGVLPFPIACANAPQDMASRPKIRKLIDIYIAFWNTKFLLTDSLFVYSVDEFCWPEVFQYWEKQGAIRMRFDNSSIKIAQWTREPTDFEKEKFKILFSVDFQKILEKNRSDFPDFNLGTN